MSNPITLDARVSAPDGALAPPPSPAAMTDWTSRALASGYDALIIAQGRPGFPVNPVPPGGNTTLGPDARGTAIGGAIGLVLKLIGNLGRASEHRQASAALEANLAQALGKLATAAMLSDEGQFVTIRAQYRDYGNGVVDFIGMQTSEAKPLALADQPELRAPLPEGVSEHVLRIHNVPNSDVWGMVGREEAEDALERLRR